MTEPIRILHCMVCLDRGGAETLMMNVYRNIDRSRIQFDFLTSIPGVFEDEIKSMGGRVYHTPFINRVGPFSYAKNIRSFLQAHPEYKIVHSHMDKFSGLPLREAKKAGVAVRIAHSHNIQSDGSWLYKAVKDYYGTKVNANATNLLACSEEAAKWMFGSRAKEAVIVKNGIDLSAFPFEPKAHDGFVIAHVGRFFKQKNHAFLLDVFREVHVADASAKLLLVGEGELRDEIQKKAVALGLQDSVKFLGVRSDVADILNGADVFCLPSMFEGLGIVLVEAQACGLPCIAANTVPQAANVTGTIEYLPLGDANTWAKALLAKRGAVKENHHVTIRAAGYDIHDSAAFLQDYYLKSYANLPV